MLDKAPSHISSSIINYLQDKKIEFSFIPGKLTRFLQPLDIGINKSFKEQLRNKYIINEANKLLKIEEINPIKFHDKMNISNLDKLRLNIIHWILTIWEDDELIKTTSIIASFKKAAITLSYDGSEDNKFQMPEEILSQYNKE